MPKKTNYLSFSADINERTTEGLLSAIYASMEVGAEHVYICLSTGGGTVDHGLHLYNTIRGLPIEVTMHNTGIVGSIGNAVFLAGDNRLACPATSFLFHGVAFNDISFQRLEMKNLRETLDHIMDCEQRIASVVQARCNLSAERLAELFSEQQTIDVEFAKSSGIISDIKEVKIPKGSTLYPICFG